MSKTKHLLQSESEGLDPTASFKKIVDELPIKNSNAYKFFKQCLGKRSKVIFGAHWHLVSHPINKFPDDWDGELNHHDYFGRLHCKSTLPKYITPLKNIGLNDPVTELLRLKKAWQTIYTNLHAYIIRHIRKFEKLDEDVMYCPKLIASLLKHQAKDPNPNFTSSYNWYYAGHGNLHIVTLNHQDYLLHSECNILYLTEFVKDQLKVSSEHSCTFDCGEDNNILETLIQNNIVVLRCMFRIFILKILVNEDSIAFEKIKNVYSEVSYTAVNFDKFHKNILYIAKLDNNVNIVNMDRMTTKNVQLTKPTSLVDNWNTVMFVDREYFSHVSPQCVEIYDKRTKTNKGVWTALTKNLDFNCNRISVAQKFDDCLYLGTTHHVLSLDIRYSTSFMPDILQRWNHNMKSPPTYISKYPFEMSRSLLFMTSQWCEDIRLIVSDSDEILTGQPPCGAPLPYSPPSIMKTLSEAKWGMLCLDLYNPIDDRLSTCISGLSMFEDGEKYVILMQNSLGDISRHVVYPEHLEMFIHDDSVESLHEWSKSYKEKPIKYEVNVVKNIYKRLMKLVDASDDLSFLETPDNDDVRFSAKETMDTLTSDAVESGLLDAWDIEPTGLIE